jgi:hypothetical protein
MCGAWAREARAHARSRLARQIETSGGALFVKKK